MIIGVPKEIKNNENRVALTPAGTQELTRRGHTVHIQTKAGEGSGFSDEEYVRAGGKILATAAEVFQVAEMIMKVKEPIEQEYSLIRKDQLVFTYFHFASYEPLAHAMIKTGAVCLAYETVERVDGSLPLLVPMSEVAGRMAIQEGAKYLEKPLKGRGILLGGHEKWTHLNFDTSADTHTYTFDVSESAITWLVDGVAVRVERLSVPAMWVYLSLWDASQHPDWVGRVDWGQGPFEADFTCLEI
jgi:hypothetical protein